jgi:hypothetical protein
MAKFEPNTPIVTREPSIVVDAGLPPGEYRFQLIVQDNQGRRSAADVQIVRVVRNQRMRLRDETASEPNPFAEPEPEPIVLIHLEPEPSPTDQPQPERSASPAPKRSRKKK